MREVGDKEAEVLRAVFHLPEGRDHFCLVPVADVVLLSIRYPLTIATRGERRLSRVDVGTVLLLRQPEGEDGALAQEFRSSLFCFFVLAHPDRSEPEHGDLVAIPLTVAVERQELGVLAVSRRIPPAIGVSPAILRGGP